MTNNKNYTKVTYQDLLEDFTARLQNDDRFKNLSSASIYYLFMEMLASTFDMTNFYMQRTAEEGFIDTARLDSSVIKHGKNLGYNPIRNTPAQAEIQIVIKGPLPQSIQPGAVIYFSQEETDLIFDNNKFILNTDYSYTLTQEDITNGQSATWSKTLTYSTPVDTMKYYIIQDVKVYNNASLEPIKIFQGEVKTHVIRGASNFTKLGKSYQFYDIDDVKFSNWYGHRDPYAWYKDTYYKTNSWTKVGIGKTQEEALSDDNLFDIEDSSIYLNERLIYGDKDDNTTLPICSLTTNSDKTVRLKFGDGDSTVCGLISQYENIYVQYLACEGAKANRLGSKTAEIKANNKFYATYSGGVLDITNNIKFVLNTDIMGGVDFESQQAIKNNAPLYFASNNRLVSKRDFVSYFRGLSTPLNVKNAIAWSQDEIEAFDKGNHITYKYIQNYICYCIVSTLYNTNGTVYYPLNVLTDDSTNTTGTFSIYGTTKNYLNHLSDYVKMLYSFNSFLSTQYQENPSAQWLKNIKVIRDNAEPKMIIGSKIFSLPPIVQYYDVVGTVTVNSLSKMQEYKREVENKIYKWLEENCNFNKKIYKSDIIKFFNEREETKAVNLDIRVSDIIKSNHVKYNFRLPSGSFKDYYYKTSTDGIIEEQTILQNTQNRYDYNTIKIPKTDTDGNKLSVSMFENKMITTYIDGVSGFVDTRVKYAKLSFNPSDVFETDTSIIFVINGISSVPDLTVSKILTSDNACLHIEVAAKDDFASLSNFPPSYNSYGLDVESIKALQERIKKWLRGSNIIEETNERPIPLPYDIIISNDYTDEKSVVLTRSETYYRRGVIQNNLEQQLTERSFWQYFIPSLMNEFYSNISFNDIEITNSAWSDVDSLIYDLYTALKVVFADSVLDDNNNIVNYSMDSEIPVVRLNITYKYGH